MLQQVIEIAARHQCVAMVASRMDGPYLNYMVVIPSGDREQANRIKDELANLDRIKKPNGLTHVKILLDADIAAIDADHNVIVEWQRQTTKQRRR